MKQATNKVSEDLPFFIK